MPRVEGFNKKPFHEGVGFFDLAYHPENNKRSSASVAYLHPFLDRPNLQLMLETWALRLEMDGGRATGVRVRAKDGTETTVTAAREVIVCAGAVDTPRLLMHSGIGPSGTWRHWVSPSSRICRSRREPARPSGVGDRVGDPRPDTGQLRDGLRRGSVRAP